MKFAICPKCGCAMYGHGEALHLDAWSKAHAKTCTTPKVVLQADLRQAVRRVKAKKQGKMPPGPPSASTPELEALAKELLQRAGAQAGDAVVSALFDLLTKK